jgi:hypothetical protein
MAKAAGKHRRTEARSLAETVRSILAGPDQEALRRVIEKSIAVSSGKGGVGKTITACNLAIHYARKGLRVGLVDLDPLSDVASLLDLHESEQVLSESESDGQNAGDGLEANLLPVFKSLEIVFPFQKLADEQAQGLIEKLYSRFLKELDARFNVLLFDMPAGMRYDDNLAYIPFMKRLILVTNPEPTAHASAGAYAKEVQRLFPGTTIHLWHNRYSATLKEGFHPSDVAGNYNRFVDPADQLTAQEQTLLKDFAFVPEDPALDLLQGEPSPAIHTLKCMRDSLDHVHGRLLSQAARKLQVPHPLRSLVTFYVHRHPKIDKPSEYIASLAEYIAGVVAAIAKDTAQMAGGNSGSGDGLQVFSPEEKSAIEGFLTRIKASGLRRELLQLQELLSEKARRMEEARGTFTSGLPVNQDNSVDRDIGRLLVVLNKAARGNAVLRSHGVLLLFHFSLYKLFQSKTLLRLLHDLIPRKTNRQGKKVRDRFRQIQILVEGDPEYRASYLKTMRSLFTIVRRQLVSIAEALELSDLVLLDGESRVDSRSYVKLLTAFLHEALYSGLSVIVGFDYRSTAISFRSAADRLLATIRPAVGSG